MLGMTSGGERILPLPTEVAAQIASSSTIGSLDSVVLGLVENALDAGARKININVNPKQGQCTVEDDGEGISFREFEERGGLGKRFCELHRPLWNNFGRPLS